MKKCVHWTLCAASLLFAVPRSLFAAEADDEKVCRTRLLLIYDAIQNYRKANQRLPDRLSDLLPRFLAAPEVLNCPTAAARGATSYDIAIYQQSEVTDTRTTYLYEFRTNTIPKIISGGSTRSMREWKQRQMGVLGSEVPIVRCMMHSRYLNLSFSGTVYESGREWEKNFVKLARPEDLSFPLLFAEGVTLRAIPIPPRPPDMPGRLIDLSDSYNAGFKKCWTEGDTSNSLTNLADGLRTFHGIPFDVRGLIQLRSNDPGLAIYPVGVANILVGLRCERLHFLHAAVVLKLTKPKAGTAIGRYVLHYENGRAAEFPILYGSHLTHWRAEPGSVLKTANSQVAWEGVNDAAQARGRSLFLYQTKWAHPFPDQKIQTLEFVSALTDAGPFLVAVTAEP